MSNIEKNLNFQHFDDVFTISFARNCIVNIKWNHLCWFSLNAHCVHDFKTIHRSRNKKEAIYGKCMHITVFVFIILLRFDDVHAIFILANHPRHGHYTKFKSLQQFSVMQWTFFLHVLRFTFIIRSKKRIWYVWKARA